MTFKSRIIRNALAASILTVMSVNCGLAQEVVQMGTGDLRKEAMSLVADKKYVDARPYLQELIKRISESEDPSLKSNLQEFFYFEAYSYLQEFSNGTPSDALMKKAIAGFDRVINQFPGSDFAQESIQAKAACYDTLGQTDKALKAREQLLERPYVDRLSAREKYLLIKNIAIALYGQPSKLQLGVPWFKRLMDVSKLRDDKIFAVSGLVQAAIAEKKYDEAKSYLKDLSFDTPSRSDIRLNVALLAAGDELFKQGKYSDAALFYSLVFSKDKIAENLKNFLEIGNKALERAKNINAANVAELQAAIATMDAQLKLIESVQSYDADLMARNARNYMATERDYESFWSYWQMINEFPQSPNAEDFYYAAMIGAFKIGKYDEMYRLGEEYLKKFPEGNYVKDVKFNNAQYFLKKKDYDSFFALARDFINKYYDERPYSTNFIFLMGKAWLDQEKYADLVKEFEAYIKKYPDSGITESCLYWAGMGYLAKGDFANAKNKFVKMLNDYPVGDYSEDGAYRAGVSAFGAGDFTTARDTLEEFVKKYPKSPLLGEVEFFLGDIYANVNEVDKAMTHYKNVEGKTKNQSFVDNSYMQGARLLHNVDRFEEEIALMDTYIEKYPNGKCSEAANNKAKAYELLGMPADALKIYSDAILKYGVNPKDDGVDKMILDYDRMYTSNISKLKATAEFLKKLLADKALLTEMVEVPAKRYRYFQENPLIDKRLYEKFKRDKSFDRNLYKSSAPLKALLEKYQAQIANYPQGGTEKVFNDILAQARAEKKNTLAFRIMMGLDSVGKPVKVSKMFNDDDLKQSSVRTLVWIGKANEKYGPEHARKAFKEALSRDEFEYEIDILFAMAALEEREKTWDAVLKTYNRIASEFPSEPRAAQAVLKTGDALAKLGKRKEAIACYEKVLRSPAWRGDAFAEALYKLGYTAQIDGKLDDALMYYDRCYLGFANCYNWTGKALVASVKILSSQGKNADAKTMCKDFLDDPSNKASPDYNEVKLLNDTL